MPNDNGRAPIHDAAVHASALTRQFGDLITVDQMTFAIEQGEIFGLIGPNSAGKSTLIKMLTTLPHAGQRIDG